MEKSDDGDSCKVQKGIIALVLLSVIVLSNPLFASAQSAQTTSTGVNLTLSPVFMNLSVTAGQSKKYTFKVTNNNNFSETYKISIVKYQPDNNGSIIPSDSFDNTDETISWFKFTQNKVVVLPKATQNVEFEISPASDAFLGYYFGIALERVNSNSQDFGTAKLKGAPTIPILLEVTRNIGGDLVGIDADVTKYKSGTIENFRTSSPWYEYLPTDFEVVFKNTGKIHLVPFGNIFISQGVDSEVSTIVVNESAGNTLPNSKRLYKTSWIDGFIVNEPIKDGGTYKTDDKGNTLYKAHIYWDKLTKFRIGRYTAHLVFAYSNGREDVPLESEISFWVIPWKILITLAIVVALIIYSLKNIFVGLIRK